MMLGRESLCIIMRIGIDLSHRFTVMRETLDWKWQLIQRKCSIAIALSSTSLWWFARMAVLRRYTMKALDRHWRRNFICDLVKPKAWRIMQVATRSEWEDHHCSFALSFTGSRL